MARSHATIYASSWSPESAFRDLPVRAQWLYCTLLTQPDLNLCGVMPYLPPRWASFAPDVDREAVEGLVGTLVDTGYVVLDDDTLEMWFRQFMFHDKVFAQPQVAMAAAGAFGQVISPWLRELIIASVPPGIREGWPECLRGVSRDEAKALLQGCDAASWKPAVTPSISPNARPTEGSGSGLGSGLGSSLHAFPCSNPPAPHGSEAL